MAEGAEALGLAAVFLVVALVYATVGQAGASGYLAAMGLAGMAPLAMKTTALALNLLVAGIGTLQFWRVGRLSWRAAYPSVPEIIPMLVVPPAFMSSRIFSRAIRSVYGVLNTHGSTGSMMSTTPASEMNGIAASSSRRWRPSRGRRPEASRGRWSSSVASAVSSVGSGAPCRDP
jgi:uncharacterized membrane protein YfcA